MIRTSKQLLKANATNSTLEHKYILLQSYNVSLLKHFLGQACVAVQIKPLRILVWT